MSIAENIQRVREEVAKACSLAGRNESDVLLLGISKFHPAAAIGEAAAHGLVDFGENYFQEWRDKSASLGELNQRLRWHLTGHLQTRKAHLAAGKFALIHTLDSEKLALAFQKNLEKDNLQQAALVEVNLGGEAQKAGISKEEAPAFLEFIAVNCPNISLRGLMCVPPASEDARKHFAELRKLRDALEQSANLRLPELSMGMSGDFKEAIEEGATIIRIGTAIFGPRPKTFRQA